MKKFLIAFFSFLLFASGVGLAQEGTPARVLDKETLKTRALTAAKEAETAEARLPAIRQAAEAAQDPSAKTAAVKALEDATREAVEKRKAAETAEKEFKKVQATDPRSGPDAHKNPVSLGNESIYKASLGALTMLLVLAVLLESALALIFHWSVFLTYFTARAWKPVIMLLGAWLVVKTLEIDVVASLVNVYKSAEGTDASQIQSGTLSQVLTALILAGGSAGVYNIMVALGFRNRREEEVAPRLDTNQAWLAIRVVGNQDKKARVLVKIRQIGPLPSPPAVDDPMPIAGTLGADRPRLRDLFLANPNRFPATAGYTLSANVIYEIAVSATSDGPEKTLLGPKKYAFAPRAIVDLEVRVSSDS